MRALALLLCAAGCGGGMARGAVFDEAWSDDQGAAVRKLRETLREAPPRGVDAVVGVASRGRLVGAALGGDKSWVFDHPMVDRPALAGGVVVGLGGDELFAVDPKTGRPLWALKSPGAHLRGAGDDGKTTVVSLAPIAGRGSVVLAVRRDGSVLRQLEDKEEIGVPAVLGRYAFLPWKRQYVSIYDLEEGREAARVLLRSVTSRAFTAGGSLWFGELGATRWDDAIPGASSRGATFVSLPLAGLAGEPPWMRPGTARLEPTWDAHDKAGVLARPDGAGFVDGLFASTYYKLVMGRSAKDASLRWVWTSREDVLGGAQHPGGFVVCADDGRVTTLDAGSGEPAGELRLGTRLEACLVQADGLSRAPGKASRSLAAQLEEAVDAPDARLVAAQRKLLEDLAAIEGDAATLALVEIVEGAAAAPDLVADARALLAKRKSGVDAMLGALGRGYDFLAGETRVPPVAPLAAALAAAGEKRAAPLLARHLLSPATPASDVLAAAEALRALAGPDERPSLERFFALYRGGAPEPELVPALVAVARALERLGAGDVVARAKKDGLTADVVQKALEAPAAP